MLQLLVAAVIELLLYLLEHRVRNAYIRLCKVILNSIYICNRSSVQPFCYCSCVTMEDLN